MFKNYLTVALRSLLKNKAYSFINISGLSLGISCSILILLWVADEVSFDSFHPKADRLYQVWINATFDGKINSWNSVPLPTYEAMKTADNHIKNSVVADWGGKHVLKVGDLTITRDGYNVGEEFLEMFEFPLLKGDPKTVLDDASSVVITESTAKALFGDQEPINQVIKLDNNLELKVSGVLKDIPSNSSFDFDVLIPYKAWRSASPWVVDNEDNWGNYSFQVYIELDDAANEAAVEKTILPMLADHGETSFKSEYFLHPLLRWRLHSSFENGEEDGGMSDYVQLFTAIAIMILVMACINFMNLATARSERRSKEVGVRKSIGSTRGALIGQFLGESFMISLIAYIISILLVEILLPAYNQLVQKSFIWTLLLADFGLFRWG